MCECITKKLIIFLSIYQGTIAKGAPIIPISAQLKYNIDVVCEYITKKIIVFLSIFSGTIAEGAPIIPILAQLKYNIDVCEYITKKIPKL